MEIAIGLPSDKDSMKEKESLHIRPFSSYNSADFSRRELAMIVAHAADRAIGCRGDIPWRLPEDMAHFKAVTMGHPVIMGRRTWETIPRRPLPGRRNIVLSKNPDYWADGAEVYASIEEALQACASDEVPFIIGGDRIYGQTLPLATEIFVTEVETVVPEADAWFPALDPREWMEMEAGSELESRTGLRYRFRRFRREE